MKMMKKKGDIEADKIVAVFIIVLSAIILFYYFYQLHSSETIDKEACHTSVVLRNAPLLGEAEKLAMPLRCKTEDIVINSKTYKTEEQVKQEIANDMYDCWWMMGEGKLSPFSSSAFQFYSLSPDVGAQRACAICSIVSFDDKWKEKNADLDMFKYISETNVPTKDITYYQAFTEENEIPKDIKVNPISTSQDYAVLFFDFRSDALWEPLVKDLGTIIGTGVVVSQVPGGGPLVKGLTKLVGKGSWYALVVAALGVTYQTINVARTQYMAAGLCSGDKRGCQQIILIPYDAKNIAQFCGEIQSIP